MGALLVTFQRASAVKSSALMQRRSKRLELAEICSRAMLSRWTRVLLYSTGFVRARKAARSRIVPVRRRFPSGGVFPQGASWHSGLESFDRGSQIEACRRACAATALTPYLQECLAWTISRTCAALFRPRGASPAENRELALVAKHS